MTYDQIAVLAVGIALASVLGVRGLDFIIKRVTQGDDAKAAAAKNANDFNLEDREQIREAFRQQRRDIEENARLIKGLQETVLVLVAENAKLTETNQWLRGILRQNGINIPELPERLKSHADGVNISIINAAQGADVNQASAGTGNTQEK